MARGYVLNHGVQVAGARLAGRSGRLASLFFGLCAGLLASVGAVAQVAQQSLFTSPEPPAWAESPLEIPKELPDDAALAPFSVSRATTATFLIDTSSVTRGEDGIWGGTKNGVQTLGIENKYDPARGLWDRKGDEGGDVKNPLGGWSGQGIRP